MKLQDFKDMGYREGPDGKWSRPDELPAKRTKRPRLTQTPRPSVAACCEVVSPDRVRVTLPLPPKGCSPNARPGTRGKMAANKQARTLAWAVVFQTAARDFGWLRCTIDVTWYHRTRNHRDRDNIVASLKASIDGLGDGGCSTTTAR